MHTPWGQSQQTEEIADGITFVSTASHGGIKVSAQKNAIIRKKIPGFKSFAGGCWYEEDCDWAIVAIVFPQFFTDSQNEAAKNMVRLYHKTVNLDKI